MDTVKITPDLQAQMNDSGEDEVLDVIVELHSQVQEASAAQSRGEAIALRKAAFGQDVASVEEAVNELGGEVVDQAWINQTVRARVPAGSVGRLSEFDQVAKLDEPKKLKAEVG